MLVPFGPDPRRCGSGSSRTSKAGHPRWHTETLAALEEALEDFAGCAVVISQDRMFLDRLATHMLAFEGDSHVEWFEGNFKAYEEDKKRRLGEDAVMPKRIKYKQFARQGVPLGAFQSECRYPAALSESDNKIGFAQYDFTALSLVGFG